MGIKMHINKAILESHEQLRVQFLSAKPFKHIIIDNFLDEEIVNGMMSEFPLPNKNEMFNEFGGKSLKHTVSNISGLGATYKTVDKLVCSQKFKDFIENITAIENLIYDPTYFGGGTHNNLSGQGMDPHVDFNYLEIPREGKVHRRINAILYLNSEWKEEWGGCLDLHSNPYDPEGDQIIRVVPSKNRMVLFETNEISWHGFMPVSNLTPPGVTRKSFAIYMYTKDRPSEEIKPRHGTFYVPRLPLEILKDGSLIDSSSLQILKTARSHCLGLIKGIYDSEVKQSQFIADREYEIALLKSEIKELRSSLNNKFLLSSWGPETCILGEVPNLQPDGSMGIWIKCENLHNFKKWKLSFNNHLVDLVENDGDLYTASIPPLLLNTIGLKEVYLLDTFFKEVFPIGSFKVIDRTSG